MLKQVGCLFDHCNLLVDWFFFHRAVGSLVSATTIAAALGVIIPIGSMSVLLTDCNETRYLSTHHKLFEVQHKNMYSCRWNFAYLHSTRRYWSVVPTDCNETRAIHDYIVRAGFELLVNVSIALVDMYAKCGLIEIAMRRRLDHHHHRRHHLTGEEEGHGGAMLDKLIVHTKYDQSYAHPLPAPSPLMKKKPPVQTLRPLVTEKKVGRTLHKVGKEDGESDKEKENQQLLVLTPLTPPPPPSCRHESEKNSRKKSRGVKDIASALAHLYKKKNKNNYDHALCTPLSTSHPAAPPLLLPRPPRHSSSVFYNLFKKSSKSKRIRSLAPLFPPRFPEAQISLLGSMKV
ncbi:hypothetical protein MRB53_002582 [Persea americana]|uniref:Uncharacterized protein n=1 Tax=Persea americana TaxID=3435 RepID=A0ACC2MWI4_PERAE|nr:hypothetical protein MRB53_002582 [Persea americana]